ncbi:MAG: CaiB/BaiF CoA transferase family protein [Planctomycetota bacterium]|jgi:crotonobetainyl-CoA:carnitine CoA-transferase CaiB-like acyl-CoA transferase
MGGDDRRVVVSVEQALSMTYATLRFVHLGWRVVKVEATPVPGRVAKGDPNRYIGRPVAGEDRHSYFVAPNLGKEAIALNLKDEAGRALLRRLVETLDADVFCTNTLPARHEGLGIDYETLRAVKGDLIWCCISAMGPDHPDVPGYDPVTQALCGYMDLTGEPDGPPLQCGPPLIDLKAGDEAFAQVLLALLERGETGRGKRIDVSMARAAVSWLQTFLPMLDMGSDPSELRRSGNQHRQFIPVNAYATRDGYVYLAVGSDAQWQRLVDRSLFASLGEARYATNEGRRLHKEALHTAIEAVTREHASREVAAHLAAAGIPHAPITPVEGVMDLPFVQKALLETTAPDGRRVRLPPAAVPTPHLDDRGGALPFAPAYGEHTDALLSEIGVETGEIARLRGTGVVA